MNLDPQSLTTATPAPRRWPVALLVAFLTGLVGAGAIAPIGDWVMEMHHVSAMEGGRSCTVIILWMPAAFIVGFASGFAISMMLKGVGFVGYLLRQGAALAFVALVVGLTAGIGYLTADHPPLLEGKNLALEIEVQVPADGRAATDLQKADFSIALVVSASDRSYSEMRWSDTVEADDSIVVKAWAPLKSSQVGRQITAGVADSGKRQIFNVDLPPAPKKIEEQWSQWSPPAESFDHSKPLPNEQYLMRYRVRFAEEYQPTPPPVYGLEDSPAPEATPTPET